MEPGGQTIWSSGVWLIPIILIVILGALYLLAYFWQKKTLAGVKLLRSELRRVGTRMRQIRGALRDFSPEEAEPYGSRIAVLHGQLADTEKDLMALEQHHVSIQERIHYLAANRWQATLGGPYFWYLLRQDVAEVQKSILGVQTTLEATEDHVNAIAKIAWEVAEGCREISSVHREVARLLEGLSSAGVHGNSVDEVRRQEERTRAALERIPPYFLTAGEEEVLSLADRESVAQTYVLVEEQRPSLDNMLSRLQNWQSEQKEAVAKITQMRHSLAALDAGLSNPPAGLLVANIKKNLEGLQEISESLHATQSRMEVESLPKIAENASKVDVAAREMEADLKKARHELAELSKLLPELNEGLRQLSAQFAALGSSAAHPVSWDKSRHHLTDISRQSAGLGGGNRPRTPEQLQQDLETSKRLLERQRELARHCQDIAHQHAELINLLESPEFRQGEVWVTNSRKLAVRAAEYDAENWPRPLGVNNLAADLQALGQGSRDLVWSERSQSIPEDEVAERLESTRSLAQAWRGLQERITGTEARLEEIQQAEQYARDQVESTKTALNQIAGLARSNPFLEEIAGQEITHLNAALDARLSELNQHGSGSVEKKARAISGQAAKIDNSANTWLEQFNKELESQKKAISERLAQAEPFKNLDEPCIAEGRRLLAEAQSFSSSGLGHKPRLELKELILELKRRSDFWQQSEANLRALDDVLSPLLETFTNANQNREYARAQITEIENWMRASRHWPPTSISLSAERDELNRLDEQWEGLKAQPGRAIQLVANLGNLASKYHTLGEKAHGTGSRIAEEKNRVEELEGQLDEMAQMWQTHHQTYRDNPGTAEEIRRLLDEMNRERENIKRSYKQGARDYSQSMAAIQALHRRIRVAQVSIDENHVIDMNGRLIAFR